MNKILDCIVNLKETNLCENENCSTRLEKWFVALKKMLLDSKTFFSQIVNLRTLFFEQSKTVFFEIKLFFFSPKCYFKISKTESDVASIKYVFFEVSFFLCTIPYVTLAKLIFIWK